MTFGNEEEAKQCLSHISYFGGLDILGDKILVTY